MSKIACVLLMGGKSTRMGTDKAHLLYKDVPFWKIITEQMKQCGPTYLSLDSIERAPKTECKVILDEHPEIGPMGGMYSSLLNVAEESVFFAPCDMPVLKVELIRAVIDAYTEEYDGVILSGADGRIYPTIGIYSKRLLPIFQRKIKEKEYRLMGIIREGNFKVISVEMLNMPETSLINLNTMNDYQEFIRMRG